MDLLQIIDRINQNAIKAQIAMWACCERNSEEMEQIYKHFKIKWETKKGHDADNKTLIINGLAKNYRYDVLEIIIEKEPNYLTSLSKQKDGFGPLHCVVWQKKDMVNISLETITKTIDILLHKYKIRIFTTCNADNDKELEEYKNETILGTIYEKSNQMNELTKNAVYDYLTQNKLPELYMIEFQHYINKLSLKNEGKIHNKFVFISHQYMEQALPMILTNIINIRTNSRITFEHKIKIILDLLMSDKNDQDRELDRYFMLEQFSINDFQKNVVNYIIDNLDNIVANETNGLLLNDLSVKIEHCYCLLFACLGYLRVFSKEQIYNKVKSYKNSVWYSKAMLYFLIHSDIDFNDIRKRIVNNKKNYMVNFITKFLESYYLNSNTQNKVMFEHIFAYKLGMKDIEVDENVVKEFMVKSLI